jgi:hypothetical protein
VGQVKAHSDWRDVHVGGVHWDGGPWRGAGWDVVFELRGVEAQQCRDVVVGRRRGTGGMGFLWGRELEAGYRYAEQGGASSGMEGVASALGGGKVERRSKRRIRGEAQCIGRRVAGQVKGPCGDGLLALGPSEHGWSA